MGMRTSAIVAVIALSVSACSSGSHHSSAPAPLDVRVTDADRCDFLDAASCLLPFPSDVFTVADATTDTGRRVHLVAASMPHSPAGGGIDPPAWNPADGVSPGSPPLALVPGPDLSRAGPARRGGIGRPLRAEA